MTKKRILFIILSWLLVFATMLIIYNFSEQNADKSAQTSGGVVKDVLDVVMPEEEITEEVIKKYQTPFRKLAHFGIFMLLGFSLANAYRFTINMKSMYVYLISWGTTILYAIFDELHQGYIEGRGPQLKDVIIDSFGGLIGICSFALMIYVFNKFYNKKIRH